VAAASAGGAASLGKDIEPHQACAVGREGRVSEGIWGGYV
jgi:hypothetical protein